MNKRQLRIGLVLPLLLALFSTSCDTTPEADVAYVNAIIWSADPDTQQHIRTGRSALLVHEGRVVDVVPQANLDLNGEVEIVDLDGRYIIPGLINAHGHVGMARGLETGEDIHSPELVREQLRLYARYGITTVVSLGDEPDLAFQVRDNSDPAVDGQARFYLSGAVLNPGTTDEVNPQISDRMQHNPDWTKIRVDSQLGRTDKMSPEVYSAVIEASHEHGVPLAAHIVELEDAKGIVAAGGDLVAHSVRDQSVDSELIELMLTSDVCITPTLTREVSVFIYADRPDFFDDPWFLREADPEVVEQLQQPEIQQRYTGESADYFREALPLAEENMMTLHSAGVRVALGTDSGPPGRFQGYFEHLEMEMMQEAGMTPAEVLTSATRYAADCMGLYGELGRLAPGYRADFIVLEANPIEDIRNLREMEAVYIGGHEVDRNP